MLPSIHTSPHARLLLARRALKTSSISATKVVASSTVQHEQQRSFRFGPWKSSTEFEREAKRRHRMFRHKHMETLQRYLSWENGPRPDHHQTMQRMMSAFYSIRRAHYTSINNVKSWSDGVTDTAAAAKDIQKSQKEAIDNLLKASSEVLQTEMLNKPPIKNLKKCLHVWSASKASTNPIDPQHIMEATSQFDANGRAIDPLPRSDGSTSSEKRTLPASTKYDDLAKYNPSNFDNPNAPRKLTAEEKSKAYTDLGQYNPVRWNEPDGLQNPTAEELSKNYTDLDEYKASKLAEEAVKAIAKESTDKPYNDLDKYKPVEWNEPDGLPGMTAEEKTKLYEDLGKYGPVKWNEPDGLPGMTAEEKTKFYKDLDQYEKPLVFNEPDGLRVLTPEEESKKYDDLKTYAEPFVAKDAIIEAHEAQQLDRTVKGQELAAPVEVQTKNINDEYKDLDKYGPVKWNEPDGLRELTPEEKSKKYEDLGKYQQYDNDGPETERIHPEEASKKYKDLKEYGAFPNNGPAVERIHPEEASKQYADLNKYPVAGYEEPDVTQHIHPEELTKNYQDLSQYRPQEFDSHDKSYPMHPEEATKAYNDLHKYSAAQDPATDALLDAKVDAVASSLKDFDLKAKAKAQVAAATTKHHRATADSQEAELSSMDESFPTSEKTNHQPIAGDPYSKEAQGLETSYVEEVGRKIDWPTVVKHYEGRPAEAGATADDSSLAQYKILAYDPASQSISLAQASSSLLDAAHTATPAEAILHLSNPSKFFPFFKPLQQEGYEIVSGNGDVLVFRKVREGASSNVDYEALAESVKGTLRNAAEAAPKRKRSWGKKLAIGTVGLAGGAYALGTFGEYYSTSGMA